MSHVVIIMRRENVADKERKRARIAAVAKELFTKFGYKTVSMEKIADSANVAKGTLYLYFQDKESLFLYLVEEFVRETEERLEKIEKKQLSLVDEIVEAVRQLLLYRKNQLFLYRLILQARELNSATARAGVTMLDEAVSAYLKRRLNTVLPDNGLDTEIIAFVIIKTYSALAFEWEEQHSPLDEEKISQAIGMMLRGVLAGRV